MIISCSESDQLTFLHRKQCRWFNRDGDGLTIEDKMRLNCHRTEIGKHCLETCGCMDDTMPTFAPTIVSSSEVPTYFEPLTSIPTVESCDDADGEFQTHVGPAHFRKVSLHYQQMFIDEFH